MCLSTAPCALPSAFCAVLATPGIIPQVSVPAEPMEPTSNGTFQWNLTLSLGNLLRFTVTRDSSEGDASVPPELQLQADDPAEQVRHCLSPPVHRLSPPFTAFHRGSAVTEQEAWCRAVRKLLPETKAAAGRRQAVGLPAAATDAECEVVERTAHIAAERRRALGLAIAVTDADCEAAEATLQVRHCLSFAFPLPFIAKTVLDRRDATAGGGCPTGGGAAGGGAARGRAPASC